MCQNKPTKLYMLYVQRKELKCLVMLKKARKSMHIYVSQSIVPFLYIIRWKKMCPIVLMRSLQSLSLAINSKYLKETAKRRMYKKEDSKGWMEQEM